MINSVYVRFITPKVNEYITEEAFHKVFDHFGCVVDVSIKESSVDQVKYTLIVDLFTRVSFNLTFFLFLSIC